MKSTTPNTTSVQPRHCLFRHTSGRFCRLPIADCGSGLCYRHTFDQRKQASADLLQRLTTAIGIHNSLSKLYKLLAADLITARRAAVLAYIANLLLRTIPIVHSELDPEGGDELVRVDVSFGDLPRPDRSSGPPSSPVAPNHGTNAPASAYPSTTNPTVPLCAELLCTEKVCP